MPKAKKAIVLFTTFWDADYLVKNGYFIFKVKDSIYQANLFIDENSNSSYTVNSIALSSPSFSNFKKVKLMERLDFWCPTYNMLHDYHKDRDWDKYTKSYNELMKKRKDEITHWINSLSPNHIYILCCWENTAKDAHCHRKLIYNAMLGSKYANSKLVPIYRDGNNKREGEARLQPQQDQSDFQTVVQMPLGNLNDDLDLSDFNFGFDDNEGAF